MATSPPPRAGHRLLGTADGRVEADATARRVAIAAGLVMAIAGLPKFAAYGWEVDVFRGFRVPAPEVTVLLVGAVEIAGGLLLARRRWVVPVALVLAGVMVVAIAVSGIGRGDVLPSLTLAPALLAALLFVLVRALR